MYMPKRICGKHHRARMQTYLLSPVLCLVCAPLCAACTSELAIDCVECLDDPTVHRDILTNRCGCQPGTFLEDRECIACHPYCEECSNSSNYDCEPNACNFKEDSYPYVGDRRICLLRCEGMGEENLYVDYLALPMECKSCHPNCKVCNDNTPNNCVECNPPFLLTDAQECIHTSCPLGTILHHTHRICLKCQQYCAHCVFTVDTCTLCKPAYFLEHTFCVLECSLGYLLREIDGVNICVPCPHRCQKCKLDLDPHTSISTLICLECFTLYYLLQEECLTACPIGLFQDQILKICTKCSDACLTCTGPAPTNCILCNYLKGFGPAGDKSTQCIQEHCEANQFYTYKYECQCNILYIYIYI